MTCRRIARFLDAYLDHELSDRQRMVFERHIRQCPDCARYIQTYRQSIRVARQALRNPEVEYIEAPEHLVKAILAAKLAVMPE